MRTDFSSRPQSSASGRGSSRNCVSTVPTEPTSAFDAGVVIPRSYLLALFPNGWRRRCMIRSFVGADLKQHQPSSKGLTMAETSVNNGVNVGALLAAREALKSAPQAAKFMWRASCKWQNGTHSVSTVQGFHGLGEEQKHKTEFTFEDDHPEVFASEDLG